MTPSPTVLVTGATGNTGSFVCSGLQERNWPFRAACRHPGSQGAADAVVFDWQDPATFTPALDGVRRIYLVAPVGVAEPEQLVRPFLEIAVDAGVQRVVLLSSSAVEEGDPALGTLHRLVRELFPEWTVLRPSWFMQNFVGNHFLADAIRTHRSFVTATGDGKLPFIDAADIAAVAVEALIAGTSANDALILTGPEALSYSEAAAVVSAVTKTPVTHRSVSVDELAAHLMGLGWPEPFAAALASLDERIRAGEQACVTTSVQDVTGRRPRRFEEFLQLHQSLLLADV